MQRTSRISKELERMRLNPTPGIQCWPTGDMFHLEASITGPANSPYENGVYKLDVYLPERYPFEPPKVTFITPVYHPNIDTSGRICLEILKMPPAGCWKPSLQLVSVFSSIQMLMCEPNCNDPLMSEIAEELRSNRPVFLKHAQEWNAKYAMSHLSSDSGQCTSGVKTILATSEDEAAIKMKKMRTQ